MNLYDKFLEYFMTDKETSFMGLKINFLFKRWAQDLSNIARNEYMGVLKEANDIMKKLQQENLELKKQR